MDKFVVPQFIDVEDKILGPVSTRQLLMMMVPLFIGAVFYKLFDFILFLSLTVPMVISFGLLAFFKVNGMPLHFFLLNLVQSLRRSSLRIWDKSLNDEEVRARIVKKEAPPPPPPPRKTPVSQSRLHEITLVVNTGGVYQPEE